MGVPSPGIDDHPVSTRLLFFTEYGFKESLKGAVAEHFTDPEGRDTPDVVIYIAPGDGHTGLLLGIEAKMFHRPSKAELEGQLAVQRHLLEGLAGDLGAPDPVLVALLPEPLANELGELEAPTKSVTWETLLEMYADVGPRYWVGMLDEALRRYPDLVSNQKSYDAYAEQHLSGHQILINFGSDGFEYQWMGRKGGLEGTALAEDFDADGGWRGRRYQVRMTPPPGTGANWFPISAFVEKAQDWSAGHAA